MPSSSRPRPSAARLAAFAIASFASFSPLASFVGCSGERLPAMAVRPEGSGWFCAQGDYSGCGRTRQECASESARLGSRVVNPAATPTPSQCAPQDTAVCYTYRSAVAGRTMPDCFQRRSECEAFLVEAKRASAQYEELSICGTWD